MKESTTVSIPEPPPRVVERPPSERGIKFHGPEGFEGMRKAGRLAAEVLGFITPHVEPGVTTDTLDRLCHGFLVAPGALPAPLHYTGFPSSIATSINPLACPGIP